MDKNLLIPRFEDKQRLCLFQIRPMGRRGGERRVGERRRAGEGGGIDRRGGLGVRSTREVQGTAVADAETAIYVEIL